MNRKLPSALLALALTAALSAPALAIETATPEDQGWRTYSGPYVDQFVSDYIAGHPQELAGFDADGYFDAHYGGLMNKDGFMAGNGLDEAGFRYRCWWDSVNDRAWQSYNAYVTECYEAEFPGELEEVGIPWALEHWGDESVEQRAARYGEEPQATRQALAADYIELRRMAADRHDDTLSYREQYPGSWEDFELTKDVSPEQKEEQISLFALQSEEEWKEFHYAPYMYNAILSMEEVRRREAYFTRWPEEYAAFDAEGWYRSGVWGGYWTAEEYRESMGWDRETFKKEMFIQWVEKSAGFAGEYCIMVNGAPVQFYRYPDLENGTPCPRAEKGRILVPLRPVAEALGLTVEWEAEANRVICSDGEKAVTFTLNSLEYSGGTLEAAPFTEEGVTYLPLRALGEALGCEVVWYQDFATAQLAKEK